MESIESRHKDDSYKDCNKIKEIIKDELFFNMFVEGTKTQITQEKIKIIKKILDTHRELYYKCPSVNLDCAICKNEMDFLRVAICFQNIELAKFFIENGVNIFTTLEETYYSDHKAVNIFDFNKLETVFNKRYPDFIPYINQYQKHHHIRQFLKLAKILTPQLEFLSMAVLFKKLSINPTPSLQEYKDFLGNDVYLDPCDHQGQQGCGAYDANGRLPGHVDPCRLSHKGKLCHYPNHHYKNILSHIKNHNIKAKIHYLNLPTFTEQYKLISYLKLPTTTTILIPNSIDDSKQFYETLNAIE